MTANEFRLTMLTKACIFGFGGGRERERAEENLSDNGIYVGDLEDVTRGFGGCGGSGLGGPINYGALVGLTSCYIPINFSSFRRNGVHPKRETRY